MSNGGDRHPLGGGSDGVTATAPTTPTTTGTAAPPQYDANGQLPGAAGYIAPPTVGAKAPTPIRQMNHPWLGDLRGRVGGMQPQPYPAQLQGNGPGGSLDPRQAWWGGMGGNSEGPGGFDGKGNFGTSPLQPAGPGAAGKGGGLPQQQQTHQYQNQQAQGGMMGGMGNYSFADGGAVPQAQGIAGMGRGQDSMLVHMTPGEVQSLQGIARAHGGSLTQNPQTGLYEAGWLSSILPMIAGGALAATGVGAPLAAGLVAAEEGIRQKDWKRGLAAGLGAYGGAGIGSALAGAGSAAAGEAGKTAALEAAKSAGTGVATNAAAAVPSAFGDVGSQFAEKAAEQGLGAGISSSGLGAAGNQLGTLGVTNGIQAASAAQPAAYNMAANTFGTNMSNMGQGLTGLTQKGGMDAVAQQGIGRGTMLAASAPIMYEASQTNQPTQPPSDTTEYWTPTSGNSLYNPGKVNPNIAKLGYLPQGETAFIGQTMNPGQWSTTMPGSTAQPPSQYSHGMVGDLMRKMDDWKRAHGQAGGGIVSFAEGGRMVDGPGDGTSDSIPASIDGVQPARLAKGEFVIPARIVSEIGNGSTEAGSQRLYEMMRKIESHRKRVSMAGDSDAEQYMPA